MKKTISKIIIYYSDGTFEEVETGISNVQDKSNTTPAQKAPVTPDFRPDYQQIRDWAVPTYQPTFVTPKMDPSLPPWVVTCGTGDVPIDFKATSTGNAPLDYKYTITSTGNGNVDISK